MEDEEIKYHEHEMVPVERTAVKNAKALCWLVIAFCIGASAFYLQSPPATKALIDQYSTWPCVVIGAVVIVVALRAALS